MRTDFKRIFYLKYYWSSEVMDIMLIQEGNNKEEQTADQAEEEGCR